MRRRSNRYAEIALTYTRPWYMRLWGALIAWFVFASFALTGKADYGAHAAVLLVGGTIAAWGGAIIAGHMKEQMADARSRLTPGFRPPHLVVAAAVFATGVVAFAMYVVLHQHSLPLAPGWPALRVNYAGFLALVLLSAAAMAWATHLQSALFIFATIAAGTLFVAPVGHALMTGMLAGERPVVTYATITMAAWSLAALGSRLASMHEEMRDYWRQDPTRAMGRVRTTGDPAQRRLSVAEAGPLAAFLRGADRLNDVRNVFAASFSTRVRHWRHAMGIARISWFSGVVFVPLLLMVRWFSDNPRGDEEFMLAVLPAILSMTMPMIFTSTNWPQRWNRIAVESLRPVESRGRFFREQGTAMASDLALTWASLTVGVYVPTMIYRPEWFATITTAYTVLLTAAGQVWLFGVCIWALRHRTWRWLAFITFIGSLMTVGILVARVVDGPGGVKLAPLIAVVLALVGLLIARDAYRRWLKTDLD